MGTSNDQAMRYSLPSGVCYQCYLVSRGRNGKLPLPTYTVIRGYNLQPIIRGLLIYTSVIRDLSLQSAAHTPKLCGIGVNLYTFGVALAPPPPPMLSSAPAMVLSAPAIIEGCQSMKWSGSIRWINNPVKSLELTDFTGFVT